MLTNTKDNSFLCFIYRTWENISAKNNHKKASYDNTKELRKLERKCENHKIFGSNTYHATTNKEIFKKNALFWQSTSLRMKFNCSTVYHQVTINIADTFWYWIVLYCREVDRCMLSPCSLGSCQF